MADVGSGLDHTATGTRDHRRQPLDGDHAPGVILVAGRRRALGAIDASPDRAQGKGNRDRQIMNRVVPGAEPLKPKRPQPFRRPHGRRRVDREVGFGGGDPAHADAEKLNQPADHERCQGPGDAAGEGEPRGQRRERDAQGHDTGQW